MMIKIDGIALRGGDAMISAVVLALMQTVPDAPLASPASPLLAAEKETAEPGEAVPLNDVAGWVTTDDYPEAAWQEGRYGTTATELQIGPNGRVESCVIVASSGSADLDDAACAALTERARFEPPVDADGRATRLTYQKRVRWTLPDTGPTVSPSPGARSIAGFILRLHIGEDGLVASCHVISANASSAPSAVQQEDAICAQARAGWAQEPAAAVPPGGLWIEHHSIQYVYNTDPQWDRPPSPATHGQVPRSAGDNRPARGNDPRGQRPPLPPGVT